MWSECSQRSSPAIAAYELKSLFLWHIYHLPALKIAARLHCNLNRKMVVNPQQTHRFEHQPFGLMREVAGTI